MAGIHDETALRDYFALGTDYICNLYSDRYIEDIRADMIVNKNNLEKLKVDIERLANRGQVKNTRTVSKPNGKIDIDSEQGSTGDCWLLAGLISMYKKPQGKELLESLLKVNEQTGDLIVTLKGVNKKYTITVEEIDAASYLSGGDGDIRAIELAFDKYIRELAYGGDSKVDINGNTCDYIYKVLLDENTMYKSYNEFKHKDFNNPSKYYTMGKSGYDIEDFSIFEKAMINEKGESVDMVTGHAYAIIKSDATYVYVVNPWNSEETLRITHEKIKELNVNLGCNHV